MQFTPCQAPLSPITLSQKFCTDLFTVFTFIVYLNKCKGSLVLGVAGLYEFMEV